MSDRGYLIRDQRRPAAADDRGALSTSLVRKAVGEDSCAVNEGAQQAVVASKAWIRESEQNLNRYYAARGI